MSLPTKEFQSQLALELVAGLKPPKEVLERYGVSTAEFRILSKTPHFAKLFEEAKAYWESDTNARDRIKAQATMLVEDSILEVFALVHNKELAPAIRLDSFKTLAKMSGVEAVNKEASGSEEGKFRIVINLANASKGYTIDGTALEEGGGEIADVI